MTEVFSVTYSNSVFSSVLAIGDKSEMDWQFVPISYFVFDFECCGLLLGMSVNCIRL